MLSGSARTRPEIARLSGLGRNVVAQRVAQLIEHGLVAEDGLGRSTGVVLPESCGCAARPG